MNTPEQDEAIWATLREEERRQQSFQPQMSQRLADNFGRVHRLAPSLDPGVKFAAAQGELSDDEIIEIARRATPVKPQMEEEKKKKNKGVFGWFQDKIKTASRYSFAALQFPFDMIDGAAGQFFDKDPGVAGWFISTDLGSLIANGDEAGDGFFIGGRAKELQAERARRYRGTIDGQAFTLGRGLASVFVEPGTTPYRILSGALDATKAVAIPTVPGAKQAGQALRIAQEAGKGGKVVDVLADSTRLVGRGSKEIQLTKADVGLLNDAVDFEQANRFFRTGIGRRIVQRTAETNDAADVWRMWGQKIDPETAKALAGATTETDVMRVLTTKITPEGAVPLGQQVTETTGLVGGRRLFLSAQQRDTLINQMPLGNKVSRAWAKMPRRTINLAQAETPGEQIEQLKTLERMLDLFEVRKGRTIERVEIVNASGGKEIVKNIGVEPALRSELLNEAMDLIIEKDPAKIEKFYDKLDLVFRDQLELRGVRTEIVDELFGSYKQYKEDLVKFQVNDIGDPEDYGLAQDLMGAGGNPNQVVRTGSQLESEVAQRHFFIPDVRQIRRLTSDWNSFYVVKDPNLDELRRAGELRLPFAVVEKLQEQIWRPVITLTGGNAFRNIIESELSIALTGNQDAVSAFRHPLQWYNLVRKNRGLGDILGNEFDDVVRANMVDDAARAYKQATFDNLNAYWEDPVAMHRRAKRIGVVKEYRRTADAVDMGVVRGHADEIGKLNADWSTRMMAGGANRQPMSVDEIIEAVKRGDKEASKWYDSMRSRYKSGVPIYDKSTRTTQWVSIDLNNGENLRYLLNSNARRLQKMTGNNTDLLRVVGDGQLSQRVVKSTYLDGDPEIGKRIRIRTGKKGEGYFANVDSINTRTGDVTVTPFAFQGGESSKAFEDLLSSEKVYFDQSMPLTVVGEVRNPESIENAAMLYSMNKMIRRFHGFLHDKPVGKLQRSPLFRNLYYGWVDKLAVSLDEASLNKIIDDIIDVSDNKPEEWLTPKLWEKLQDLKANPDKLHGSLNANQVSQFASGKALDEIEKMTYNAVERRNVTDALRIISPFAQQQAEFIARMFRNTFTPVAAGQLGYLPNPQSMRKLQLIIEGGRDADPDGDGRGFFFKNPSTGEWSFTFPLVGELTKLAIGGDVSGVSTDLVAPVKNLVLGLDVRPGLGPFATIAASQIMPDIPQFDFIRNIMLPYGENTNVARALTPSYVQKIYEGVTGNTSGRFFANTYVETMQALAATGKYDLSLPAEKERLLNDARSKAQVLTVLRGFTQFTGPAAGDFELKVPTDQGDMYAAGLGYALRHLREINYDTATLRFIEIFGEDAFSYLSNKTVSEVGGLESSEEFYDFQRNNGSLFAQYKDVAGYFGPSGTEFSFEAYTRQLQSGQRRRLTAEEVLEASEKAIGLAFYKDMRNYFGNKLTSNERAYLSEYRKKIAKTYPGFGQMEFDPQKTQKLVDQLFMAAKMNNMENNPVATALNLYEEVRAAALQEANARGLQTFKSDKALDLQDYLNRYAQILVEKYPEFGRVYDRVLAQELY